MGSTYNVYEILREMDTFLKELRLSGYKISDFREPTHRRTALLVVVLDDDRELVAWLHPSGVHAVGCHGDRLPYYEHIGVWHSTEELEEIIMEFLHGVG